MRHLKRNVEWNPVCFVGHMRKESRRAATEVSGALAAATIGSLSGKLVGNGD